MPTVALSVVVVLRCLGMMLCGPVVVCLRLFYYNKIQPERLTMEAVQTATLLVLGY
jgi:hypothetical protein